MREVSVNLRNLRIKTASKTRRCEFVCVSGKKQYNVFKLRASPHAHRCPRVSVAKIWLDSNYHSGII
jgi:hypothetical protein